MDPSRTEPRHPLVLPKHGGNRSNLAAGLLLLPAANRKDAFLFHDFCRLVDDIADDPGRSVKEKREILESWLHALLPEHDAELPAAFREMIGRRCLDRSLLAEIVTGMLMDTERNRYGTFGDLRLYCHRVASTVGIVSAGIFGARGACVERYAGELGLALQLTNILRDVAEDAAMNRIYIPLEDLERFGVREEEILRGNHSPSMTHLMNHQAERADSHFAKAETAWSEMSANQRRLMKPARFMSGIYRELLLEMHRDRYDVFAKRYRVSRPRKLLILLRVMTSGN